jgi:hypothetical protein
LGFYLPQRFTGGCDAVAAATGSVSAAQTTTKVLEVWCQEHYLHCYMKVPIPWQF